MGEKDDDLEAFRAEMEGVKRSRPTNRVELDKPKPKPLPSKQVEDDRHVMEELLSDQGGWDDFDEAGNAESFLRQGLPRDVLRKLKRGEWTVQDETDLHGVTFDQARDQLAAFLLHARRHGIRCVKIIHGKGLRSLPGAPILRSKVRRSLTLRDDVLAFCDAPPADGGSGAVIVLLRG
jgi:DNA-nicking Smr family endonuclease